MRHRLLLSVAISALAVVATAAASAQKKSSLVEAKLPTSTGKSGAANATTSSEIKAKNTQVGVKSLLAAINPPPANQSGEPVESRAGKMLARMQGKRQTNLADAPTRRNEDPWFLDQSPYPLQPYRFVYNIKGKNGQTEQYRQEVGDGKFLTGSYGYVLPDGIYRHVDYIADDRGFRAFIRTSEPGTANQNPANVVIQANPVVQPPGQIYSSVRPPDSLPAPLPTFGPAAADVQSAAYAGSVPPSSSSFGSDRFGSSGAEVRRAPGSIVNNALGVATPTNNFSATLGPSSSPFQLGSQQPLLPSPNFGYRPPGDSISNLPAPRFGPPATNNLSSSTSAELQPISGWSGSISDQLDLARINRLRQQSQQLDSSSLQRPAEPASTLAERSQIHGRGQSSEPRRRPESSSFGREFVAPTGAAVSSHRLAYDTPLSIQGALGPEKLSYDTNHIFHPNLPYLSLERARGLAQIGQLNAINPSPGYIRPLHLSLPASSFDTHQLGLLQPVQRHFSSSSSHSTHSKQEEHHHRHQVSSESQSQAPGSAAASADSAAPAIKEHRTGAGSVREFEHHQTISHGLPPPPAPTFSGQSTFQSRPPSQDATTNGAVKGGGGSSSAGNGRLLAPYASLPEQQQQQQQRDEHLSDGGAGDGPRSGATKGGPVERVPPAEPAPPVEPSPPVSHAPTAETTPSPPPESDERQRSGSVKGGGASSSSAVNEREKRRPQEPFAWFHGLPPSDPPRPLEEERQPQHKSALSAPVRSVRMPGEMDYRSTILMNDLRSMQNMIGLPQPPRRLNRHNQATSLTPYTPLGRTETGIVHQAHSAHAQLPSDPHSNLVVRSSSVDDAAATADERLNGSLNSADRIVSARMSRLEALLERAGQLQRQQQQQQSNSTGSTNGTAGRAASVQRASIAQIEEAPSSGGPAAALAGPGGDQVRRFSTGLVQRSPAVNSSLLQLNELSLEDNLVKAANETFDARRLSQAKRLQAEKVSELEKFQQRLRAQQLFLEHSKSEPAGAGKAVAGALAAASKPSGRSSDGGGGHETLVNSHVKYDEEGGATSDPSSASGHLKAQLFKSLDPSLPRDFARVRRQPEAGSGGEIDGQPTKKAPGSEKNSTSLTGEQDNQQQRQRKLIILQAGATKNSTEPASSGEKQQQTRGHLSEFARQIKRWPSIVTGARSSNSNSNSNKSSAHETALNQNSIDTMGATKKPIELPTGGVRIAAATESVQAPSMNFLNSVATLSAHQLNPFSLAGANLRPRDSESAPANLIGRTPANNQTSAQLDDDRTQAGAASAFATTSARYSSSPELLAALHYHEERDTSGRLMSMALPVASSSTASPPGSAKPPPTTTTTTTGATAAATKQAPMEPTALVSWASNHRYHRSAGAPYAHHQPAAAIITSESAARDSPQQRHRQREHQISGAGNQKQQQPAPAAAGGDGALSRDGFDIRDRSVRVDDERFYEVVSSSSSLATGNNGQQQQQQQHPSGWGQFQAFKDAQLSIPALAAS